jgi:hypothetical protein
MGIPFYRLVEYLDDGHYLYQCLQCGEKIDVGDGRFDPRFCCYCGVEYKGAIIPKRTDYISIPATEELWFQIESALDWEDNDTLHWTEDWRGSHDPIQAVEYLKDARKEKEEDNQKLIPHKILFRITVKRKTKYNGCIIINTGKFRKRTGKDFNSKDYQKAG